MPLIDRDKCQGCGLCASVCALNGLAVVGEIVTAVKEEDCDWCALCELVCPNGAITCPFEVVFEERKD
ncbi:MAG: 4Fe-4S binding protein [Chloroflexota bacterium]